MICTSNTQDAVGCVENDFSDSPNFQYYYYNGGAWNFTNLGMPQVGVFSTPSTSECVDHGNGPDHNFIAVAYQDAFGHVQTEYRGWSPGGGWGPWFRAGNFSLFSPRQSSCVLNPLASTQNLYVPDSSGNLNNTYNPNESNPNGWTNWFFPF